MIISLWIFTHADGSGGGRVSPPFVCVSLVFYISKIDAARITKLDVRMFHDESWKSIYFGVIRSKVTSHESQKHCRRGSLHCCDCWLLLIFHIVGTDEVRHFKFGTQFDRGEFYHTRA